MPVLWTQCLWVGCGGFLGSVLRHGLNLAIQNRLGKPTFPFGIFLINVLGCLAIGFLAGWDRRAGIFTEEQRLLALTGVLGGFTTFSTFGWDTLNLERLDFAVLNVAGQVLLGLGAVWVGIHLAPSR